MGNKLKAARGVFRAAEKPVSWAELPSTSVSRSTLRRLSVTAHADSAIRDGNIR
jgi:hypothetical protein